MTFEELRKSSGMTRPQFAAYFGIPYRTVQSWELEERTCPAYLFELMKYKLDNERAKRENPYITFR
jgi:DNA-binding transcriptional regulator YiaG